MTTVNHNGFILRAKDQKALANAELALRIWKERVKPEEVVGDLSTWRCGTQACFGGHLAMWPEFREMGVYPDGWGAPKMEGQPVAAGVSYELFGTSQMFATRREHEPWAMTDHELVVWRLEQFIWGLQSRLK